MAIVEFAERHQQIFQEINQLYFNYVDFRNFEYTIEQLPTVFANCDHDIDVLTQMVKNEKNRYETFRNHQLLTMQWFNNYVGRRLEEYGDGRSTYQELKTTQRLNTIPRSDITVEEIIDNLNTLVQRLNNTITLINRVKQHAYETVRREIGVNYSRLNVEIDSIVVANAA